MSEETMDLTPQLTLTPDTAAAAPQAPSLTLEPNADQQQTQVAQQAAQAQREANAVKIDESMLSETERKMVDDFAQKIDVTDSNLVLQYGAAAQKNIASFSENGHYDCYMVVAKDKTEALVTYVQVRGLPNNKSRKFRLQGLDSHAAYWLEGTNETYTGELLMKAGYLFKDFWGDAVSRLYHFIRK